MQTFRVISGPRIIFNLRALGRIYQPLGEIGLMWSLLAQVDIYMRHNFFAVYICYDNLFFGNQYRL